MPVTRYAPLLYQHDPDLSIVFVTRDVDAMYHVAQLIATAPAHCDMLHQKVSEQSAPDQVRARLCFTPVDRTLRLQMPSDTVFFVVHRRTGLVGFMQDVAPDSAEFFASVDRIAANAVVMRQRPEWAPYVAAWDQLEWETAGGDDYVAFRSSHSPSVAQIQAYDGAAVCSGVLIGPRTVMTTASCLETQRITQGQVVVTALDPDLLGGPEVFPFVRSSIAVARDYSGAFSNDYAVVHLVAPCYHALTPMDNVPCDKEPGNGTTVYPMGSPNVRFRFPRRTGCSSVGGGNNHSCSVVQPVWDDSMACPLQS